MVMADDGRLQRYDEENTKQFHLSADQCCHRLFCRKLV